MAIIIAVTGGIGCGKTTVANQFAILEIPVIDSDQLAHQLVTPGMPALASLARQFGNPVLLDDGALNRTYLRQLLLHDKEAKNWIEKLLHPLIYQESWRLLNKVTAPYALWLVPLLIEKNWQINTQRTLVVDCTLKQQITRLKQRDQLTHQQAMSLLKLQCKRRYRLAAADDIIDNSGSIAALSPQIISLHHSYLALAAELQ